MGRDSKKKSQKNRKVKKEGIDILKNDRPSTLFMDIADSFSVEF